MGRNQKNFEEHGTLFTEIWMFIEIRMLKSASKGSEESEKCNSEKTCKSFKHRKHIEATAKILLLLVGDKP